MCVSCWQPEVSRQQKPSVRSSGVVAAVCRRTAMLLACQNRRRNDDAAHLPVLRSDGGRVGEVGSSLACRGYARSGGHIR